MPRRIQRTVGSSWRGRDGPGPPPSCAWEPASQPGAAGPAWASDEFSGALTRLGSRLLDIGRQSGGSFLFGPAAGRLQERAAERGGRAESRRTRAKKQTEVITLPARGQYQTDSYTQKARSPTPKATTALVSRLCLDRA